MTKSSDIANLFARFGGQPDSYQELSSQANLNDARKRWPLLRAIDGERDPAPESVKTPPILKGKSVEPRSAAPSVKAEHVAKRNHIAPTSDRTTDDAIQVSARPLRVRPEVQRRASPAPRSVGQAAQPIERPISEVFSKLAAKSQPEPEPEAPKPSGLFSSLRRVVRK